MVVSIVVSICSAADMSVASANFVAQLIGDSPLISNSDEIRAGLLSRQLQT